MLKEHIINFKVKMSLNKPLVGHAEIPLPFKAVGILLFSKIGQQEKLL